MGSFNIEKAIARMSSGIVKSASSGKCTSDVPKKCAKSVGLCATAVQEFLRAGGIDGAHGNGYRTARALSNLRFKKVVDLSGKTPEEIDAWCKANAKAGDVCGMSKGSDINECGHIAMFDGKDWVCDFNHTLMYKNMGSSKNTPYVYASKGNPAILEVYRFV